MFNRLNLFRWIGSLRMAVSLLVVIAGVLAWGTIYETRFGTHAVQRFVYQAWWFQALLGFLALNLGVAAFARWPWKLRQIPFLLAHLGIILILVGGIIGGRFGIEGQLIIPEGDENRWIQLPRNVLTIHASNPGSHTVFPTNFEATAWDHKPHALFRIPMEGRLIELVVDRYYPNAVFTEEITDEGTAENPAVHLHLASEGQEEDSWLLSRDPDRFGVRWGPAHLLFLEPRTPPEWNQLFPNLREGTLPKRGVVDLDFPDLGIQRTISVPEKLPRDLAVEGTPYRIGFKDYFADFTLSEQGPISRSDRPDNPAVSFTLSGPEGTDAHLLFALHPDFQQIHGRRHKIHAHARYSTGQGGGLPPSSVALVRLPSGKLLGLLIGETGERETIDPLEVGIRYTHSGVGLQFEVSAHYPNARVIPRVTNRNDEVRAEALHLMAREGDHVQEAWLPFRGTVEFPFEGENIRVEYRPAQWELPFAVRLKDFRKIDYPGTQTAQGFESDVELADPTRGLTLARKISMNNPLKYRGFSLFQSSYIPGAVETTVLSVRSDPGTPVVYLGFLIVVAGIVAMFILRRAS